MTVLKDTLRKLKPMLASPSAPFDAKDYIFEVKWDGFRCLAYLGEDTCLRSRNNLDLGFRFPELMGIHRLVRRGPLIVDGEIVIMQAGVPSFYELQKRGWMKEAGAIKRAALVKPATYVVFDILYAGDKKLMTLPLAERKELLRRSLDSDERLFISEGIPEQGIAFYRACISRQLEGVVAKKLDSLYYPGKRSPHWKKFKKAFAGDFVICGYKQTHPHSERVDALLLGGPGEGPGQELVFQGTVGAGLAGLPGRELFKLLSPISSGKALFSVPGGISRSFNWVEPKYCCTVEFLEPARDGGLRHPVFRGMREDLAPHECTGIAGALAKRAKNQL